MPIISQETWDKFTEEEKAKIKEKYRYEFMEGSQLEAILLEDIFGKENLQSESKIRTWKDVEEYYTHIDIELDKATKSLCDYSHCSIQLLQKCIATLKIAKLIELGYGGIVNNEEWKDSSLPKYTIVPHHKEDKFIINAVLVCNDKQFIAFHTPEQAEEFMSYPENLQLIKNYHMI